MRRFLVALFLLGAWQAAYWAFGWKPWILPAPTHVAAAIYALLSPETHFALLTAIGTSAARFAVGFPLSILLGAGVGFAMWRWPAVDTLMGDACLGMQTLPSVCWVPIAVLLLGLGEAGIQLVLLMGSMFALAISLRDGLRTIPPLYRNAGLMLGARGMRLFSHVLLPASLPAVVTSVRAGFAFAWRSLIGAELIIMVRNHGLGYLLHEGREFGDVAQVLAVMFIMIALASIVDRVLFGAIERRVHRRFGLGGS